MIQNIYIFFTFCSVQCFKFVISRYLWFEGEKIWFVKVRVHYIGVRNIESFIVLPIMLWLIRRFWRKFTVQKFACMFEICGCVFSHVFGIYGRTSKHAATCGNHKIFRNIRPHGRMFASHNIWWKHVCNTKYAAALLNMWLHV